MTPFGEKIRGLRKKKGVNQAEMAKAISVSPAYLSALESGKKGKPSWGLVQEIIRYFDIIWDEAEELQNIAKLSHPRVVIDTSKLSSNATKLANIMAQNVHKLSDDEIEKIIKIIK